MHVSSPRSKRLAAAGFTLVELLVTMLVVSVGMLGLVKMEAAAVSESQVSRVRSLLTFQAESLAGMMRANRGYWAATTSPFPSFSVASDGTVATSATANGADATCQTVACSTNAMAYADMKVWSDAFKSAFPAATASVTCVTPTAGAACTAGSTIPTSYDIKLTWTEKSVAINRAAVASSGSVSMVLHVQP